MRKKNEIEGDYKRFFKELFKHLTKSFKNHSLVTTGMVKKILIEFALKKHFCYKIKMHRKYERMLEKQIKAKLKALKKQDELHKKNKSLKIELKKLTKNFI